MSRARVLFVQHANPAAYPPVWRAATCLQAAGADVRVLGIEQGDTLALGELDTLGLDVRVQKRGSSLVGRAWSDTAFVARAVAELLSWRPDWVYVFDTRAAPVGVAAAALGFRVAYHEHDIPVGGERSRAVALAVATRRVLARRAALRIAPNRERAAVLRALAQERPVQVVWNCPLRREVGLLPSQRTEGPAGSLRLLYAGSVSRARLPLHLVDALARLQRDVRIDLRAYETVGTTGYLEELRRRARDLGVGERLRVLPPAPHREVMAEIGRYDLGLSLFPMTTSDPNDSTMAGASNKVFEYLAGGIPALVPDRREWRETFVAAEVAFACDSDSAASIAAALDAAAADPDRRRAMGTRGRARVLAEWNYETAFAPVVDELLAGVTSRATGRARMRTARAE